MVFVPVCIPNFCITMNFPLKTQLPFVLLHIAFFVCPFNYFNGPIE